MWTRTPSSAGPAEMLLRDNRQRGVHPGWHTTQPRWRRDDDIPAALLVRALEAADPGEEAA